MGKYGVGGRTPKPTHLKALEGGRGHSKINREEPMPKPVKLMRAPRHLSKHARKFWRKYYKLFKSLGVLSEMDVSAFELLAETFAEYTECMEVIKIQGRTFTSANGYTQQRPEVGIIRKARKDMESLFSHFGMTPASRSRIKIILSDNDEFEKLLD